MGKSLFSKLWVTMIALVLMLFFFFSTYLSQLFSEFYFDLQAEELVSKGKQLAVFLAHTDRSEKAINIANVIAATSKATVLIADTNGEVKVCTDQDILTPGMRLLPEEFSQLQAGQIIIKRSMLKSGIEMLVVGVPIVYANKIVGSTLFYQPIEPITQITYQAQKSIFFTAGVAVLLATFLAYFIARSLSKPIRQMTAVATGISKGNFRAQVEVESEDEIGQLGTALNTLSTELEHSLNALSQERDQLANILTSMTDAVFTLDPNGYLLLANPPVFDYIPALASPGEPVIKYLPDSLQEKYKQVLQNQLVLREDAVIEQNMVAVSMSPVFDKEGNLWGVVAIVHDVTKERKLEKMRKDFVANVSHELRTPLSMLQGYGEALMDGLADNDKDLQKELISIILDETSRMRRLVNDLLELTKWESGQQDITKEPVNVKELLERIEKRYQNFAHKHQLHLKISIPEELPTLCGNVLQLEQVFANLLDNAFKNTPIEGEVYIRARFDQENLIIDIQDTGTGIPPEDLPFIWDRFYKGDKARTRSKGGTGLGLAIVKSIVEAHGGSIEANSKLDEGTTFTMRFPFSKNNCTHTLQSEKRDPDY